jgi:hypothetical protein
LILVAIPPATYGIVRLNGSLAIEVGESLLHYVEVVRIDREIARETNRRIENEMSEMRSEMREMHSEIRGIQLECQRIWEYLFIDTPPAKSTGDSSFYDLGC